MATVSFNNLKLRTKTCGPTSKNKRCCRVCISMSQQPGHVSGLISGRNTSPCRVSGKFYNVNKTWNVLGKTCKRLESFMFDEGRVDKSHARMHLNEARERSRRQSSLDNSSGCDTDDGNNDRHRPNRPSSQRRPNRP
jgi:hypothetical protein